MTGDVYIVRGENGEPDGVVDLTLVNSRGAVLAFAFAVASNAPRQLETLTTELVHEVGAREAGYISAAALGTLVQDILEPLIAVVEEMGHPVRERLRRTLADLAQAGEAR